MAQRLHHDDNDMQAIWEPPLRKYNVGEDNFYPFNDFLEDTNLPAGFKQHLLPPSRTVLDNAFPTKDPQPGTFKERVRPILSQTKAKTKAEAKAKTPASPFGDDDAATAIQAEDIEEEVGFRTMVFPGYSMVPANSTLPTKFPPVHRLALDDRRRIADYNTPINARARVAAGCAHVIHWASCDQRPSQRINEAPNGLPPPPDEAPNVAPSHEHPNGGARSNEAAYEPHNNPAPCCEKSSSALNGLEFGDLNSTSYPQPEIKCFENAHTSFTANRLNVRKKSANGEDSIHFFSACPDPSRFLSNVENLLWHNEKKIVDPSRPFPPFCDVELGIFCPHGSQVRGGRKRKKNPSPPPQK